MLPAWLQCCLLPLQGLQTSLCSSSQQEPSKNGDLLKAGLGSHHAQELCFKTRQAGGYSLECKLVQMPL